jgi:hypothetical protein
MVAAHMSKSIFIFVMTCGIGIVPLIIPQLLRSLSGLLASAAIVALPIVFLILNLRRTEMQPLMPGADPGFGDSFDLSPLLVHLLAAVLIGCAGRALTLMIRQNGKTIKGWIAPIVLGLTSAASFSILAAARLI